ncbi:UNKNOWN [Stylonychia lemnae]|uniref:Glycosyltransferase 2-like domain-containing protein n=1 Tax=Stylonychia lemnae TaxID=5949 RepID=A0A078AEW5_STYLE|nr:UNKNOWN [Stylonychia lemnae]|eukprot:CDW80052.1 UNKNOWN [Stylonychia lemnae]
MHEVLVVVKNQQMIDKVSSNFKNEENIKFLESLDVEDFAKILQTHYNFVNGEYIVLIHAKTINKMDRTKEQISQMKTYSCNVIVSDIDIVNEVGELLDNSYLINIDYARNLDQIIFKLDFRFEASLMIRKGYLAQFMRNSTQLNRYYLVDQIVKDDQVCHMNASQIQISLINYQESYIDSINRLQQDSLKYLQYNAFLNDKNIRVTTQQFFKIINCTFDFLGCDEEILDIIGHLLIMNYLTDRQLQAHHLKLKYLNQTDFIFNYLTKLKKVRENLIEYPLVSVIMASYNRDYYLLKSIQYVLQQTYVNWELLISDDGSNNPKTLQILQLAQNHPRIRVFYLYTNQYNVFAYNHAITQARGEYLAIHDDDDIMMPYRLEYQVDYLRKNSEYEICAAGFIHASEIGKPFAYGSNYERSFADTYFSFLIQNHVAHSTITVKLTQRMKQHFIYNHQTACDYSLWLKLLFELNEDIKFAVLGNYVTGIRYHNKRLTYQNYEASHYTKWMPLKQIEIAEKIYPEIFDRMGAQCFQRLFYTLRFDSGNIEVSQDQDIQTYFISILKALQKQPSMSYQDIKSFDRTFNQLYQGYIYSLRNNMISIMPSKRTFACIYHHGNIQPLLIHIDQLKVYVDYFIVIYLTTSAESVRIKDLQKNKVIKDNKQKISFELKKVSVEQVETYKKEVNDEMFQFFVNHLVQQNISYHEYVIIAQSTELINPYQLRRFQKLNTDFGIFGLRKHFSRQNQDNEQYIRSKIMTYQLFEKMGFKKARDFVIDPDIFKQINQPVFEDKLQTLFFNDDYYNIHTMKDAGIYFEDYDCGDLYNDQNLSSINNAKTQQEMSFAEKRKLSNFYGTIQDQLKSQCPIKHKKVSSRPYTEL